MSTSENIKRIRKERGLTQKQLAKMLNVSESMISQYESKNSNLRLSTIRNISEALDVTVGDIVDDWSNYSIEEISDDFTKAQERDYYKELNKRQISLIYELIGTIFKKTGKYPVNLNNIDGLDIFMNKKLTEYKTLSNEELKAIEKDVLNYLDFILDKALKNKESKKW